ncbi:MAG: twin-arginine translocase subunit TatC [Thermoanaerobaculia bacterium]
MSSVDGSPGNLDLGADPDAELPKMGFLEHLDELRKRLIYSFAALAVAFLVCWNFAPQIFHIIELPLLQYLKPGERLAYTRMTAPFFLYMKVAFFAAVFLASPFILTQLWLFIAPGLYRRERRYALPFILFASLFFLAGGYFSYRLVFPMACKFFVDMGRDFQQVITVDDYFGFANKMILGMGLIFETPILIFFLARLGIVTPAFLMQKFKYAVVVIFIIAAVITPTPDMVTQSALAVPMILLYLLGVLIAWLFGKRPETD